MRNTRTGHWWSCDNCDTSWEKKVGDREGVLYYPNYPYFTVHCRLSPLRWHALRIYQKICQSLSRSSGQQLTHSHLVTGAGVLSVLCWQSGVCWVSALTFTWTSEYNDTHTSTLPAPALTQPDTAVIIRYVNILIVQTPNSVILCFAKHLKWISR